MVEPTRKSMSIRKKNTGYSGNESDNVRKGQHKLMAEDDVVTKGSCNDDVHLELGDVEDVDVSQLVSNASRMKVVNTKSAIPQVQWTTQKAR